VSGISIDCVLFDLGKVLIDFDNERALDRLAARSSLGRDDFQRIAWDPHWVRRYERGEVSTADYHSHLRNAGGLDMGIGEFRESWASVFLPEPLVSQAFLTALKARYPLVLLSNTNEAHVDFLFRRYPAILDCFDRKIFSHEVGSLKPDRAIYEAAIAAAGKPAGRLFFTDDREENIEGARRVGMHARQFVSETALIADLRAHGVAI
jgi:putative hydrolase of the HAD superfamily